MAELDRTAARAAAQAKVAALAKAAGDDFAIVDANTEEAPQGWLFFYNSREFIDTGDELAALAGNGPILVTRDGDVRELPSATPWQEAIGPA